MNHRSRTFMSSSDQPRARYRLLDSTKARRLGVGSLMVGVLLAARASLAQPAPAEASLNDLVLSWLQGNYATPIVCTLDGQPRRGLRRILIEPAPPSHRASEATVRFVDLAAADATRCFTEIGGDTPNITGALVVRHPTTKRRPTVVRDFKTELKRKRGFELDIVSGTLELEPVGEGSQSETWDMRGGHLRVHILRKGEDGLRVLQDLPSPRKVRLEIEARDGRLLSFPASLARPNDAKRRPSPRR